MSENKIERYSFSKLNAFHTCPYMFKQTYIDQIKGDGNAFASYGLLVHSLMERYEKGEINLWDLPAVYEWEFDTAVPETFPSSKFCKDMRALYYQQGLTFLQNFQGYNDIEILGAEKDFEYKIDDWMFNGVIDLIYKDQQGRLVIQDYKSKATFKNKAEQAKYARQLYLYSIYVKDTYGRYPDILKFSMFRKEKEIIIPFDQNDFDEAVNWAKNTVKEIRNCWDYSPRCEEFFAQNLCNHRNHCEFKIN